MPSSASRNPREQRETGLFVRPLRITQPYCLAIRGDQIESGEGRIIPCDCRTPNKPSSNHRSCTGSCCPRCIRLVTSKRGSSQPWATSPSTGRSSSRISERSISPRMLSCPTPCPTGGCSRFALFRTGGTANRRSCRASGSFRWPVACRAVSPPTLEAVNDDADH